MLDLMSLEVFSNLNDFMIQVLPKSKYLTVLEGM